MAIAPTPSTVLLPVLVVGLALAVRGATRRLPTTRPGLRVPIAAGLGWLVFAALSLHGFDTPERRFPILVGLGFGALSGLLWEWAFPPDERDPADLGPLGGGLVSLATFGLAFTPGVAFANAALGLLAGWAVPQVVRWTSPPPADEVTPRAPGLALAVVGLAAGASAWAMRLAPAAGHDVGPTWPLPLAVAAIAALGLALAGLTGARRAGAMGAAVAGLFFILAGLLAAGPFYQQPPALLLALAAGGVAGFLGGALLPGDEQPTPVAALAALVVAGALLVLENRLLGVVGIGLGGLGLLAGAGGTRGPRPLIGLAVAIFAARVWLQLFLDRTSLTGYGVDLTHPYTFAALILGGLLPGAAIALGRPGRALPSLAVAWGLALALLPAWLGFLVHVEAVGGLLAGLLLASFLVGARGLEAEGGDRDRQLALMPALMLQAIAVSMLAAPWLVDQMNAERNTRVYGFLAVIALAAVALARWGWAARQAKTA